MTSAADKFKQNRSKLGSQQSKPGSAIAGAMQEQAEAATRVDVRHIPLERIYTESQVRDISNDVVAEYASSFRDSEAGQPEQAIKVWANPDGRYLVLFGEHRYRAQLLNQTEYGDDSGLRYQSIIAQVVTGECPTGHDRARLQLQENILRNPISPIEIALAVKSAKEGGAISSLDDAVKWLGLAGTEKAGTAKKELSQALSLLADPSATDLVELVRTGEMKVYKAKNELALRQKSAVKAAQDLAIKEASEDANRRVADLQKKLNDVQTSNSSPEAVSSEEDAIKKEIEKTMEEAKSPSSSKVKPSTPQRFSLEYKDALTILEILDKVAQNAGLESVNFDGGSLNRKQWESIISDRLVGIRSEL